ncbi:phage Gp37/Gp68 family protein [Marinovum sp. SP66]|uniref:phage Gp37/Gp68 family protein n=1 Tax=Marinovum TaxID=367771 RepID=UPI00237AA3BB|nr:phage Gp37/Gp68 family protein [Marinovum sp. SP66]MDD9738469.1 phage Gp37/Gp68 family protein [Marinovum sp. SP66]
MADTTKIEWTDATWNPITGCTLVDDGCRNCYAAELAATRLKTHPSRAGLARKNAAGVAKFTGEVRFNEQWLTQPLGWKKPRMVFVCAHGDLFHESVPNEWIDQVFAVMALSPRHTFQVLTKRPDRAREYLLRLSSWRLSFYIAAAARDLDKALVMEWLDNHCPPLPNVWLGTSVSDQASADARIPELLATPAAVRFLSAEPLLGPICLTPIQPDPPSPYFAYDALRGREVTIGKLSGPTIDWIIVGGESGRNARPMHPDWARSLRDQCKHASVAFFFKQWGSWATVYDRDAEDPDWRRCDQVTRETPKGRWLNLEGGHGFHGDRVVRVSQVGKKAAGRLLDGREWSEVPGCPRSASR